MSGFDYARLRERLSDYETARWSTARLRMIVDAHERETPFGTMGKELGVSKNACISQAHRLGLPPRGRAITVKNHRQAMARRTKAKVRTAPKPVHPPAPTPLDRRHQRRAEVKAALALPALHMGLISSLASTQCKWPIGDPKASDFGFCGCLKLSGGPYCACHKAAAIDRTVTSNAHRGGIERLAQLASPARPRTSRLTGAWA